MTENTYSNQLLNNIRIVLVQTYHPGNIGAVARAMHTMGLSDLVLVNPKDFPSDIALQRAAGGRSMLEQAKVVTTLSTALCDCQQVFASTARRQRNYQRPEQTAHQAVSWAKQELQKSQANKPIAFVFGRERMGLSQSDIEQCQQQVYIPGNPDYDVLNLAQAVQIISYECQQQLQPEGLSQNPSGDDDTAASHQDLQACFEHLQESLDRIGFLRQKHPGEAMQRLKHFILKARPSAKEVRMLRGICSAIDWHNKPSSASEKKL